LRKSSTKLKKRKTWTWTTWTSMISNWKRMRNPKIQTMKKRKRRKFLHPRGVRTPRLKEKPRKMPPRQLRPRRKRTRERLPRKPLIG
jgi:hypothetical protein